MAKNDLKLKHGSKTTKDQKSDQVSPRQKTLAYERHLQGAIVWTVAVIAIWLFIVISYLFKAIDTTAFVGVSITGVVFIIIYYPFLWGLKKITRKGVFEIYNLSINFIQAIGDTVIIYYMGGIKGMYLILAYASLIAYVGVVAPFHYPFVVATVCAFSFGVMVLLEHFAFIPHMNNKWGYHYTLTDVVLIIIMLTATLYVLAFILSYTANLLRTTRKKLRLQNERLEKSHMEINKAADVLRERNDDLKESMDELNHAQEQLVESKKMAALGGLVAGVAHEINTPVGVGITAVSFLQDKTRDIMDVQSSRGTSTEEINTYLTSASEAASIIYTNLKRAADLVHHFKQVAVDQFTEAHRKFDLKEYIDGTLLSMRYQYKRTGHTITVNCPDQLIIDSYPGVFSQIITNLTINSLTHGFDDMESGHIIFDITQQEDRIHFRYSDNGKGMDAESVKRIFEPFYTTKRGQGGSGLGMHIVYNIITQTLGGKIRCTSSEGKGAVFDIEIPLLNDKSTVNPQDAMAT